MKARVSYPNFGALVISLDFERHWGIRDREGVNGSYEANLSGEREAVLKMLDAFREFEVAATWATVGFLFADSKEQIELHTPKVKPEYLDGKLDSYREEIGLSEEDDPFHYAPSLVEKIRGCPRQEIGSHTFSHYYCLEPGQGEASFRDDLRSAASIARTKGVEMKSIVFPRNQHNPHYEDLLLQNGISCYRGNQSAWMYQAANTSDNRRLSKRLCRLADTYLNLAGHHTVRWDQIARGNGALCNVPASFYVRPFSPLLESLDFLRLRRIEQSMRYAAEKREIVHIWWHPHDFGTHTDENIAFLKKILRTYQELRRTHRMKSLSMSEVADVAREVRADQLHAILS